MLAATGAMLTAETTGTDPIAALSDLTARIITQVQG
jgi:hypothetical protein